MQRLVLTYKSLGFKVSGVVLSFYEDNPNITVFTKFIKTLKVPLYKHYKISGYPENIELIVSSKGLAFLLNVSEGSIRHHLNKLQDEELVKHVGPDKGGYWEVLK